MTTPFQDLNLNPGLLRALEGEGYASPTPIQAQAIPPVMAGRDLLGIAQTGTGKTAAFALPILHRLTADKRPAPRRGCRCLVLSPTRELASQIADSFKAYGRHLNMSVGVIFGGVNIRPQIKMLEKGVDVLVATPGRLLDHLGQHTANLADVEIFVLDEADQMLDLGFILPIRRIIKNFKQKRQNLFFSATMPAEIGKLAGELLHNPAYVSVAPESTTVERVTQQLIHVEAERKRELLAELFADPKFTRTLVFTRTKRGADKVAKHLEHCGVSAAAIHGDKSQPQREKALAAFKAGQVRALVATDIAARGIDVEAVSHVVQFELPNVPEAYVHRIGRTARAGASGSAVAFCSDDERPLLKDIQKVTRQTIPAIDRRRDPGLAVMAKATKAQEIARGPEPRAEVHPARTRPAGEPRRQPHRQRRMGGGAGGAPGGGRAQGAPAQGPRSQRRPRAARRRPPAGLHHPRSASPSARRPRRTPRLTPRPAKPRPSAPAPPARAAGTRRTEGACPRAASVPPCSGASRDAFGFPPSTRPARDG